AIGACINGSTGDGLAMTPGCCNVGILAAGYCAAGAVAELDASGTGFSSAEMTIASVSSSAIGCTSAACEVILTTADGCSCCACTCGCASVGASVGASAGASACASGCCCTSTRAAAALASLNS